MIRATRHYCSGYYCSRRCGTFYFLLSLWEQGAASGRALPLPIPSSFWKRASHFNRRLPRPPLSAFSEKSRPYHQFTILQEWLLPPSTTERARAPRLSHASWGFKRSSPQSAYFLPLTLGRVQLYRDIDLVAQKRTRLYIPGSCPVLSRPSYS